MAEKKNREEVRINAFFLAPSSPDIASTPRGGHQPGRRYGFNARDRTAQCAACTMPSSAPGAERGSRPSWTASQSANGCDPPQHATRCSRRPAAPKRGARPWPPWHGARPWPRCSALPFVCGLALASPLATADSGGASSGGSVQQPELGAAGPSSATARRFPACRVSAVVAWPHQLPASACSARALLAG